MIEALCTGLVPIVTDVGTIADWIVDGRNGHFVPVGDSGALASSIERLMRDADHMRELRQACLAMRPSLSLDMGLEFWRAALDA